MAGVKQAREGTVGILTLDEPASLNAMTPDLLGALAAAIGEMSQDEGIRALILTGAGRGFCSGQNLKASEALGEDIAAGVMRFYWPAFKALRECRVPVVVAVNGVSYGNESLRRAVTAAKTDRAPIELLLKAGDQYRTIALDYRGGLQYPHLERDTATSDRLTEILSPRAH